MDEYILSKFKTPEETKAHLNILEFWEKDLHEQTKEDYAKFSRIIRKDLFSEYGILHSLYHVSLRNRIEVELEYQKMVNKKFHNTIMLHPLVRKNCNSSTLVLVDDVLGNLIKALYNYVLVRGEDCNSLPKYMESSKNIYQILDGVGLNI